MIFSTRRHAILSASVAAVLVAGLAACGSDSTGPEAQLTEEEVASIGSAVAQEMMLGADLMTVGGINSQGITVARIENQPGVFLSRVAPMSALGIGCPEYSEDPPTDTDADGVPDDLTLTFALPACRIGDVDEAGIEITGSIGVQDPTPNEAGLDFQATATGFKFALYDSTHTQLFARTHTGSWSGAETENGFTAQHSLSSVVEVQGRPNVYIANSWSGTFVPAAGHSVDMAEPLPPGELTVAGQLTMDNGTNHYAITLVTAQPLQVDRVCANDGGLFKGGEVHATFTGSGPRGYVRIVWTGCGEPTYTFVASSE